MWQMLADGAPFIMYTPDSGGGVGVLTIQWSALGVSLLVLVVAGVGTLAGLWLMWVAVLVVRRVVSYFEGQDEDDRLRRQFLDDLRSVRQGEQSLDTFEASWGHSERMLEEQHRQSQDALSGPARGGGVDDIPW